MVLGTIISIGPRYVFKIFQPMQCYPKRPDFELSRPKVFKMICIFSFFANCSRSNMMANNPTQHLGNYRIQIMFSNYGGSFVVHSIF